MSPENRRRLADRVAKAAEASLAAQNYVSPVDVLVGIGWLDPGAVKRWRQGQGRLSRARRPDESVAHFGGYEAVSIMGDREGVDPE